MHDSDSPGWEIGKACVSAEIRQTPVMPTETPSQSEREFYLAEFRRRSIGFAWPADEPLEPAVFRQLVDELVANQTRVVLLSARDDVFEIGAVKAPIEFGSSDFAPRLWRALGATGCSGLRLPEIGFEAACCHAALSLKLSKVVWVQSSPPITRSHGDERVSVVDLAHLELLLGESSKSNESNDVARPDRRRLLEAIRRMIEGGIPAVNVCQAAELAKELMTYAGAGTFFTRDRYAEVRKLGLDDFDSASDLISRGEADGFLVPRDTESRNVVLAHAVGLFIEGRYLAGIGAILPYAEERAVEVASLYALTRYVGEGAGGQIVRYAIESAREDGLAFVFSCTTSEHVEAFFVRNGFRVVDADSVPKRKWENYDNTRRKSVRCLRFDL